MGIGHLLSLEFGGRETWGHQGHSWGTERPAGWRVFWVSGGRREIFEERRERLPTALVLLYPLEECGTQDGSTFGQSSTSDPLKCTREDNVSQCLHVFRALNSEACAGRHCISITDGPLPLERNRILSFVERTLIRLFETMRCEEIVDTLVIRLYAARDESRNYDS
jgi:hypothetical protein